MMSLGQSGPNASADGARVLIISAISIRIIAISG
jgi:hypothetical protein